MKKRILFFGTPQIAVPVLEKLSKLDSIEIVGVCCPEDKKVGRKRLLSSCAVKNSAKKLGLNIYSINNKKEVLEIYEKLDFDLAIVIAFGVIFPEDVLDKPEFGTVNVHFSQLPEFRGASPVQSAILQGQKESGITIQKMVKKLDAGDILWQKKWNIENKSTSFLWEFFAEKTANEMPEFLDKLFSRDLIAKKQDENSATFCGKFEKADGEIFPKKESALEIWNKYLAFDVWPGIFLQTKYGNVKLGEISRNFEKNSFILECVDGKNIYIKKAQVPGKKMMDILDVLKGRSDLFE